MAVSEGKAQPVKVLIDTNVMLDVALQRLPYLVESDEVFSLSEAKKIEGYLSAAAVTDFYYIACRSIGHASSINFLRLTLTFCKIVKVDQSVIYEALEAVDRSDFKDFEDAVQNYTAVNNGLEAIVTRNTKDFAQSTLKIVSPTQLIQALSQETDGSATNCDY